MARAEDELNRTRELVDRLSGTGPKRESRYYRVSWHSKQRAWRVKVKHSGSEFYKEFKDEEVAAWVADCASLLIQGRDGAYDRDGRYALNFDWRTMVPPCPDPNIAAITVYEWLLAQHIPVMFKPSNLH